MEAYFSTNNFITLPYHSSYWMGYQAPTWGASNFRTLDRWGLPVGPGLTDEWAGLAWLGGAWPGCS